jgi:hypothetical protein
VNPSLSPKDGIIIRDFAYTGNTDTNANSFTLKPPGAPALPRKYQSERSMQRSFSRKPTSTTIATSSPKTTATCSTFTAAQCSFTTKDYHHYGLSTQILQQAIDDGDGDTEDEDEEVYSQALQDSKVPDHVLMPPPPMTLSPKVFKPPAMTRSNSLFAGKGGLQIFGLSTQVLNEAISAEDDDVATDEDSDEELFSIPITRPPAVKKQEEQQEAVMPPPTTTKRTDPSTGGLRDFGLSTQILQDAALDDIEFTDDEDTQGS